MSTTAKAKKRKIIKKAGRSEVAEVTTTHFPVSKANYPKKFAEMNEMLKKTKFLEDRK
jgi:hypothetical protein